MQAWLLQPNTVLRRQDPLNASAAKSLALVGVRNNLIFSNILRLGLRARMHSDKFNHTSTICDLQKCTKTAS